MLNSIICSNRKTVGSIPIRYVKMDWKERYAMLEYVENNAYIRAMLDLYNGD